MKDSQRLKIIASLTVREVAGIVRRYPLNKLAELNKMLVKPLVGGDGDADDGGVGADDPAHPDSN